MHRRILIQNALLVNEGRRFLGSLFIEDDHIEEILPEGAAKPAVPADGTIDAAGCYLLPGAIDTHVHFREPGLTHKACIATESRAAAAGGVTTCFDMPNVLPQTTSTEALNDKLQRFARESYVNYGAFFGATRENACDLAHVDARRAAGIKLFMGASTGGMLVDGGEALAAVFENAQLPIVVHCEDSARINAAAEVFRQRYAGSVPVACHSEIRSREACFASTQQAIALARQYGANLHVAHISTKEELALFSPADSRITAEACLPHLLFTTDDYARLGTRIKCNPAVKACADREALRHALTDGRIATVATDHAPHLIAEKQGDALTAASGMPMVQFALPAMLDLSSAGVLTLERVVELMCHAPARRFAIDGRGFLREGAKADLVLVRPHSPWTLTPNQIESRCNWSPLEGHTFSHRVEATFCNGALVYRGGQIVAPLPAGQAVTYAR